MNKYDISIILPGIRVNNWEVVYNSVEKSVGNCSFEVIFIGPYPLHNSLWNRANIKYIRSLASPCVCYQIGVYFSQGKYINGGADDCLFVDNALIDCFNLAETIGENDIICSRYCEGQLRSGTMPEDWYWQARKHADLQIGGVLEHYKTAPVHFMRRDYFVSLGGLDCRFENCNMVMHDLAFRVQNNGGQVYLSPGLVMSCDWDNHTSNLHGATQLAYEQNDKPLLHYLYQEPTNRVKIDFENWRSASSVWQRRFRI